MKVICVGLAEGLTIGKIYSVLSVIVSKDAVINPLDNKFLVYSDLGSWYIYSAELFKPEE